ncbi:hypothetical protein CN234_17550 [Sinorhizobium meliloti]|uniref:hypothetical protein n=1 Tax=Rhizobium meliloti TaxID=382 RepID=UPI000FDA145A|nr:hypothetical protein [Sinorhizobium meliloti]RVG08584.1 hypothetical protein CN234_17550 [Sinorhizobium meliloti]
MTVTTSSITGAWLGLSPDIRSRAEEIAGNNRPVAWPEVLLLVGTAIAGERERCAAYHDDLAAQQAASAKEKAGHDAKDRHAAMCIQHQRHAAAIRRGDETEREAME